MRLLGDEKTRLLGDEKSMDRVDSMLLVLIKMFIFYMKMLRVTTLEWIFKW